MKKCLPLLLLAAASCAWPLGWPLPVLSLRSDLATGASEDPEEPVLLPDSVRATATLKITERVDPLALALAVTGSLKDYLATDVGDYRYVKVEQQTGVAVSDRLDLDFAVSAKRVDYALPDTGGLSKDVALFTLGSDARLSLGTGTSLSIGLDGRWEATDEPTKARQRYAGSLSFSWRLGEWLLSARYRAEVRLRLGLGSTEATAVDHTGGFALQWDPNQAR